MGVMDKFLNYMKLNDEEEEFYDDDYLDDQEEVPATPRKTPIKESGDYEDKPQKKVATQPKVTPIRHNNVKKMQGNGMEVCVIRPTSVDDAREITETLLANRTVVLNLEGMDMAVAQRIIDFTSGSCFAIGGNLQRISNSIFIITPASVDLGGRLLVIFGGAFESPINNEI